MFKHKAGLSKHQKQRCRAKKKHEVLPPTEEIEKVANVAKNQYISLKGTMFKKCHIKDANNLKISKNKVKSGEILKIEIKQEKHDGEWEYEFLDEAFLDVLENKKDIDLTEKNYDQINQTNDSFVIEKKLNFTCDYCGLNDLQTKNNLQKHFQQHIKGTSQKIFKHSNNILNNSTDPQNVCKKLTKQKQKNHKLKLFERKRKDLPFICDYCGKEVWTRSSIQTHLLITHKTVADFNCTKCCKKFKTHGNLYRHIRSVHDEEKSWGCEKCGRMFKEKYQLEIHVHNHDERKCRTK